MARSPGLASHLSRLHLGADIVEAPRCHRHPTASLIAMQVLMVLWPSFEYKKNGRITIYFILTGLLKPSKRVFIYYHNS